MNSLLPWLRKHSFQAHVLAIVIMVTSAALLYLAARSSSTAGIYILIGLFILGNLLELAI